MKFNYQYFLLSFLMISSVFSHHVLKTDKIRVDLLAWTPSTPTETRIDCLKHFIPELRKIPTLHYITKNSEELISKYATEYIAHQSSAIGLTAEENLVFARSSFTSNSATGFTGFNDVVYVAEGVDQYDIWHEYIHILSGKDGDTKLKHLNEGVNEGFINFFAEKVAQKMNIPVVTRYNDATDFVKRLRQYLDVLYPNQAKSDELIFRLVFFGELKPFLNKICSNYLNTTFFITGEARTTFREKNMSLAECMKDWKNEFRKWSIETKTHFFKQRLPEFDNTEQMKAIYKVNTAAKTILRKSNKKASIMMPPPVPLLPHPKLIKADSY